MSLGDITQRIVPVKIGSAVIIQVAVILVSLGISYGLIKGRVDSIDADVEELKKNQIILTANVNRIDIKQGIIETKLDFITSEIAEIKSRIKGNY